MKKIRDSHLNASYYASIPSLKPSLLGLHLIAVPPIATISASTSAKEESIEQIGTSSSSSDTLHAAAIFPASHATGSEAKVQVATRPEVTVVVVIVAVPAHAIAVGAGVRVWESVQKVEGVERELGRLLADGL